MSPRGDKFRNRPEEDPTTRRSAEDEIMRGDRKAGDPNVGDRGVGQTGAGNSGGSGTAGGGIENEGTGSLLVNEGNDGDQEARTDDESPDGSEDENVREGYEDQGSSRDADGTQGESSGSRPGSR